MRTTATIEAIEAHRHRPLKKYSDTYMRRMSVPHLHLVREETRDKEGRRSTLARLRM